MKRSKLLTLVGAVLLAAGAVPPWVMVAPWHEGAVVMIQKPGMGTGLETGGLVTLPLGVLAGALGLFTDVEGRYAWGALGIGALALLVTLGATFLYAFPPTPFSPGVGAAVTFVGALCVLGGGVDAVRGSQRPESQPSRASA